MFDEELDDIQGSGRKNTFTEWQVKRVNLNRMTIFNFKFEKLKIRFIQSICFSFLSFIQSIVSGQQLHLFDPGSGLPNIVQGHA